MSKQGENRHSRSDGEKHQSGRTGWLRAAVLGSNDAIVSTASLMIGVLASSASEAAILVAGIAGLVAGAMSMAVGEYVSVSSQRDAERADIAREKRELAGHPEAELHELAAIYVKRGLGEDLACKWRSSSARTTVSGPTCAMSWESIRHR
jgi:VIT1/CCC1 family predicted Fe2+/Mn2+ transporter